MSSPAPLGEFILPSTDMTVAGVRLRSTRFPNGIISTSRAILCLPGYAATGESFARLRPLAGEYDIRLLTLPEDGWRQADPVDHFGGAIAELAGRLDHPVLLGTSFGGLVALDAAGRLGARASGLILISTFARAPRGRWLLRLSWQLPFLESLAAYIEPLGVRIIGGKHIDQAAAFELRQETHSISRREKHARLLAALRSDVRETVSRITVPALIIHGLDDHLVPIKAARELTALLPHAELVEIAGAGHLPYLTHPGEVNAALSRFLSHAFEVEHHAAADAAPFVGRAGVLLSSICGI